MKTAGLHVNPRDKYNSPAVEAGWDGRPSWKAFGKGRKWIEIYRAPQGELDIHAQEISHNGEGKRDTIKEVYISLPPEVVAELKRILLTEPATHVTEGGR